MDQNSFVFYLHELNNQCVFAEGSLQLFNNAMEQKASTAVFLSLQNMLLAMSQVSNLLWPENPDDVAKDRAETLRTALAVPEDHPAGNPVLRDIFTDADKKTDKWINSTKDHHVIVDYIGRRDELPYGEKVEDESIFRMFDPETKLVYYRGEVFDLQEIVENVGQIAQRVRAAHEKIFPQDKSESSPDPTEAASAEAAAEVKDGDGKS